MCVQEGDGVQKVTSAFTDLIKPNNFRPKTPRTEDAKPEAPIHPAISVTQDEDAGCSSKELLMQMMEKLHISGMSTLPGGSLGEGKNKSPRTIDRELSLKASIEATEQVMGQFLFNPLPQSSSPVALDGEPEKNDEGLGTR
jgi:hypothetical protein